MNYSVTIVHNTATITRGIHTARISCIFIQEKEIQDQSNKTPEGHYSTKLYINEFQQYPSPLPRGRMLVSTGQFTSCKIMDLFGGKSSLQDEVLSCLWRRKP